VQKGFFRGGNVAGLSFVSGQQSGITDATGAYTCETNETVSFSIGAVDLGEMNCATMAHAVVLAPSGQLMDPIALNIMRLLLILDQDSNPDNGVFISEPLRSIAQTWAPIDLSAADFEPELTRIISDIASVEQRVVNNVPGNGAASTYLDASLSCAYSGVYVSVFGSGPFNTATAAALTVFRDRAVDIDIGEFLLFRQEQIRPLFAQDTGSVQLGALPTIEGSGFTAEFDSPDTVSGEWTSGVAAQDIDTRGSFDASRMGHIDGEYRFTGMISGSGPSLSGAILISQIALKLEGDSFFGEAFDNIVGFRREVTGKRLPATNSYELEVELLGSATGTIVVDADGEPIGLQGDWPGLNGSVPDALEAVGCRLN